VAPGRGWRGGDAETSGEVWRAATSLPTDASPRPIYSQTPNLHFGAGTVLDIVYDSSTAN